MQTQENKIFKSKVYQMRVGYHLHLCMAKDKPSAMKTFGTKDANLVSTYRVFGLVLDLFRPHELVFSQFNNQLTLVFDLSNENMPHNEEGQEGK